MTDTIRYQNHVATSNSSWIRHLYYNNGHLHMVTDDYVYTYQAPLWRFVDWAAASSAGRYYDTYIKGLLKPIVPRRNIDDVRFVAKYPGGPRRTTYQDKNLYVDDTGRASVKDVSAQKNTYVVTMTAKFTIKADSISDAVCLVHRVCDEEKVVIDEIVSVEKK